MAKKLTYAQIAEKLTKLYNKYDKNLQNAVTKPEENSAIRMLHRVSNNINELIVDNQNDALKADAKNPPADSPNQSIGRRTAMMAQDGGTVPNPNINGLPWLLARSNMSAEAPDPIWMGSGYKHLAPEYRKQTGLYFNHPEFSHDAYKTWMGEEWARQKANLNLQNRLMTADSLNALPYQHQNFELPNFRPSQEDFNQMEQSLREQYSTQYPGFYQIPGIPTKEELQTVTNKDKVPKKQLGGQAPPQSEADLFYTDGTRKRIKVIIGRSKMGGRKGQERIIFADELPALKRAIAMRGGNLEELGALSKAENIAFENELKQKRKNESVNEVNSMLSNLVPSVRDVMLQGYKDDPNFDVVDGKVIPIVTSDTDDTSEVPVAPAGTIPAVTPTDTPTDTPVDTPPAKPGPGSKNKDKNDLKL